MKPLISVLLRGACAAFVFAASSLVAEEVRNGDFADGHRFWNVHSATGLVPPAEKDAVLAVKGGALSLDVAALRKGGRGVPADVRLWQKVTSMEPGRSYRLSFQARTTGVGARGTVNVRFGKSGRMADGSHNTVGGLPISHFDVTDLWAPFSFEFAFNGDGTLELPKDLEQCWLTFAVGNVNRFELRQVSLTEAR
jgi:hypothetical protein